MAPAAKPICRRSPRLLTPDFSTVEDTQQSSSSPSFTQAQPPEGGNSMLHSKLSRAPAQGLVQETRTTPPLAIPVMTAPSTTPFASLPLATPPDASSALANLQAMALSLGFVVTPIKKWAKAIARAIATSLRTREGEFIYQSAAIRMPEVPREN